MAGALDGTDRHGMQMSVESLKERLTTLIEPIAQEQGLFLYDLEISTSRRMRIRVVAERKSKMTPKEGITVGECAELSRRIDERMELEQLVTQAYLLEVSSPGLERKLKTAEHFEHALTEWLEVVAIGATGEDNLLEGRLEQVAGNELVLAGENGAVSIDLSRIKRARTIFR
ncbi:MAG: hypothetical protein JW797_12955 [Bradymonadales bacterium]|nr:hypothetical protein [Bradymonadales bacterium]